MKIANRFMSLAKRMAFALFLFNVCASVSNAAKAKGTAYTDFIRGFDASSVDYDENVQGFTYCDADGNEKDFFKILSDNGVNTVRLRVWVNPKYAQDGTVTNDSWANAQSTGDVTLERVIRMAKRCKEAGLKIMLDFHYSDYWTDPGKQIIPYDWQNLKTSDEMAKKISEYTKEVLTAMKAEGVLPDYVQVGNEIDPGILVHTFTGKVAPDEIGGFSSPSPNSNFAKYLKAGCKAVRDVSKDIQIIIHVTNSSAHNSATVINAMKSASKLYDIIGLSYYPWESTHRTVQSLKNNIQSIRLAGKKAMVVETSMIAKDVDNASELAYITKHLLDPKTGSLYEDIETDEDGTVKASVENQRNGIAHIMKEVADAGGIGVCVWGGQLIDYTKWCMFGSYNEDKKKGRAFESIDVFKTSVAVSTNAVKKSWPVMTIKFKGFTLDSAKDFVSVKYSNDKIAEYDTQRAEIASDGKSAAVKINPKFINSYGFINDVSVTCKKGGEEISPFMEGVDYFDATDMMIVNLSTEERNFTKLAEKTIEVSGGWGDKDGTLFFSASELSAAAGAKALKVELSDKGLKNEHICLYKVYNGGCGDWIVNVGPGEGGNVYYREISINVADIISNGLYVKTNSTKKITLTVSFYKD